MKKILTLILIAAAFANAYITTNPAGSFRGAIKALGQCWVINNSNKTLIFNCEHGRFTFIHEEEAVMITLDADVLESKDPYEKSVILVSVLKGKKETFMATKDKFDVITSKHKFTRFLNPYEIYDHFKKNGQLVDHKPKKKEPLSDVGRVYTTYKPQPTPEEIRIAQIMEKYK